MVQGTMSLEGQGLPQETIDEMIRECAADLMKEAPEEEAEDA